MTNQKKLSTFGIGPSLILYTVIYSLLLNFLAIKFHTYLIIDFIPSLFFQVLGTFLLLFGGIFLIISIFTFVKEFPKEKLVKTGAFALVRNPIYSSFICFIVPGIIVFTKSILLMSIPFLMYVVFAVLIKKEEKNLEMLFGSEYLEYKLKVGLIIPKIK